ncbi:MAG: NnrS family protein [Psychromonas sp.]|nr:NnrS family protein [Psychromonas sp.]
MRASGVIALIGGCANIFSLLRWKPMTTLSVALLWSLHLSYLLLSFGLIVYEIALFVPVFNAITMINLTAIGGISGVILAMISRVSLGHTGRRLTTSKWMILAFVTLPCAAVVRVLFATLMPHLLLMTYWITGFILFILFYAKMLVTPRIDKKTG